MNPPDDTSPDHWHRWFAASANNAAWVMAERADGEFDPFELLNAAHAAAWHWQQTGTELNRMRARMLLAQAHAQCGLGVTALRWAEDMRTYFLGKPDTPDWEIAFAHVVHARAAWAAASRDAHAASCREALRAIAAIVDPEDRRIVEAVFRFVPPP